jgi:hypothetical protein
MILPPLTFPSSGFQTSMAQTTNLSQFVGTGVVFLIFSRGDDITVDNPLIRTLNSDAYDIQGTETITYYYGSSFLVPEPASLVMFLLGLPPLAVMVWCQRKAKLAT